MPLGKEGLPPYTFDYIEPEVREILGMLSEYPELIDYLDAQASIGRLNFILEGMIRKQRGGGYINSERVSRARRWLVEHGYLVLPSHLVRQGARAAQNIRQQVGKANMERLKV